VTGGFALAVHGGAGDARGTDPAWAEAARAGLAESLAAGGAVLAAGGSALDAVVAAVVRLEDCPAFNAGRGSVLNDDGEIEMDAALMEGDARRAGAVAGVQRIANPVRAAQAVLRDGRHVLLAGAGAERFARAAELPACEPGSLVTDARRVQWQRARGRTARGGMGGTVGAVARDAAGHLAAATSTGGVSGKLAGRVSDSAQIGAGTWADDATCAVSATGDGDVFIRAAFASRVDAHLRFTGASLADACARALAEVAALGGSGGCIAIARTGAAAMPFLTESMPRGTLVEGREMEVWPH
jgi:isoaspartyl peptidase/L-asparaginase-like protein (Ntn-hydrolase superfamily)